MVNIRQDFGCRALTGTTFTISLTNPDGTPFNLTGYTALVWKAGPQPSGDALVQKTGPGAGGITVPTPANGQAIVTIANTDITEGGLWFHTLDGTPPGVGTTPMNLATGRVVVYPAANPPGT